MFKAVYRISIVALLLFTVFPNVTKAQLAPGVQQSAAQTATITGTVVQNDGQPVAGADVRLIGPAMLATKSDVHGTFDFVSVPYGVYRIVTVATNFGTASRENIVVKGDITMAIQYEAQAGSSSLKTIAHVSTSSAGAQINVAPASIASVNPSEYAFQGNTSWRELLNQIPGVAVGGFLGGGASTYDVVSGSPFQPIVLSINGALPYETSTTLDGMPLENTSGSASPGGGTDLSYLPSMPTFDTADVVRGPGADAPSIVNSIGGSFVLHPPGSVDKDHFEFSLSDDPYGGIVSNTKVALHFGRFSATLVYGLNDSPGPLGTHQDAIPADSPPLLSVNGQPWLFGGLLGVPAGTNATYQNCNCVFQNSLVYCCVSLNTAWTQHSGAAAMSYAVTHTITAQVFYAGSSAIMNDPSPQYTTDFTPGAGYAGNIAPGTYHFFGINAFRLGEASSLLEEKVTAYVDHGVLRFAALQYNSFSDGGIPYCVPNGQYTLYGTGTYASGAPAVFNGTSEALSFIQLSDNCRYWVNNRDLLASYAVQIGSASNIGISYVKSYYNDPYQISESIPYYGFSTSISQSNAISETTNEFRLHVGTEVSSKLSLDASWYSATGAYHVQDPANPNAWENANFPYSAPRLGATWRANSNIVIRAAAGGGYALPPINYLVGLNTPLYGRTYFYQTITNLHLKPEESFGFDLGTDMRFHRNTVLSMDLYRTNLYGQFFQSANFSGSYFGFPLYTTEYENLSQSRFEGINLDIRHDVPQGIYWHGALGLTRAYVVSVPPGFYNLPSGGSGPANTYVVPGINFDGEFQSTVPYATASAQFGYRWSPEKYVDISPTYYGKNNTYFEPAFVEIDAHLGYPLTKSVSLLATFRNITNIYGQNYQFFTPSMGAPTISGQPYALFGIPYGPRTVIVTAQVHL